MNTLLWILQILLALWNTVGGLYTLSHYENLRSAWANPLPKPAWAALCVLQVLCALGLVLPGATGTLTKLTPLAAAYLAVNSLLGCALFARYTGPGMLWGVAPGILAAFVSYGRMTKSVA